MIRTKTSNNRIKRSGSDKMFNTILMIMVTAFLVIVLYPLIYIVSCSISSGNAVTTGQVLLWPVDISFTGYEIVFSHKAVWTGYANTILYTVVGSAINLVMTIMAAYPLSRRDFSGRNAITMFYTVPLFFGGGLIPSYILVSNLHLTNTRWAMIILGALNLSHMIIMRTFFQSSIPLELLESAKMDGISDLGYLMKIVIPLSKASISVITLYSVVGHWNAYFMPMIYLRDRELYPLQLVLREILSATSVDASMIQDSQLLSQLIGQADVMKYALIVVATVPMLVLYPFVQKFFEKGVMIGSVKG